MAGYDFFYHGLYMWFAWTFFAVLQVSSNRYFKAEWLGVNMWIHRIVGTFIMIATLYHGINAWKTVGWNIIKNLHSIFVFPILFSIFFIAMGGVFTRSRLRRSVWSTAQALRIKRAHKSFAYFIIYFGTFAIMTGLFYYRKNDKHPYKQPLEVYHMVITLLIYGTLETIHYFNNTSDIKLSPKSEQMFTVQEFQDMIKDGRKLVILDDIILDVDCFMDDHPGGKFSISHNIGNDISKFFYGGYSLENKDKVDHHVHSTSAKKIANKLAIGYLTEKTAERIMNIDSVDRQANKSGSTKTIKFKNSKINIDDDTFSRMVSTNCSLLDISQIGRHYLIQQMIGNGIISKKRHYTEAFCMRSTIYENLLNLADNFQDTDAKDQIEKTIQDANQESLCLTLKRYNFPTGMSKFIHDTSLDISLSENTNFIIKGPMSKGLSIPSTGRCIAITGGTGVLVFIDLVAHLILRVIAENGGPNLFEQDVSSNIDLSNFTFELYTSFTNPDEAIAFELITKLVSLCQTYSLPNLFKHCKALEGLQHDTSNKNNYKNEEKEFYEMKLDEYKEDKNVKKVWVCGPPGLMESFDKSLYDYNSNGVNKLDSAHVDYCII